MRALLVIAALLLAIGCADRELVCTLDTECVGGRGEFGLCLQSRCAFLDADCTGGYRWDDAAGSLKNMCADPATVGGRKDAGLGGRDAAVLPDGR
jgi:hypothetical protein